MLDRTKLNRVAGVRFASLDALKCTWNSKGMASKRSCILLSEITPGDRAANARNFTEVSWAPQSVTNVRDTMHKLQRLVHSRFPPEFGQRQAFGGIFRIVRGVEHCHELCDGGVRGNTRSQQRSFSPGSCAQVLRVGHCSCAWCRWL